MIHFNHPILDVLGFLFVPKITGAILLLCLFPEHLIAGMVLLIIGCYVDLGRD